MVALRNMEQLMPIQPPFMNQAILLGRQVLFITESGSFRMELLELIAPMDRAIAEWRLRHGCFGDGEPMSLTTPPDPEDEPDGEAIEHAMCDLIALNPLERLDL